MTSTSTSRVATAPARTCARASTADVPHSRRRRVAVGDEGGDVAGVDGAGFLACGWRHTARRSPAPRRPLRASSPGRRGSGRSRRRGTWRPDGSRRRSPRPRRAPCRSGRTAHCRRRRQRRTSLRRRRPCARRGRPRQADRVARPGARRTGRSRHPIVTENSPTPVSSTIPGHRDTDPGDLQGRVPSTRRRARRRRPRCCRAPHRGRVGDHSAHDAARATRRARGSRPSATCRRRRRRRRQGDRRRSPHVLGSRMTLNDSDCGWSGSRPAWRASSTASRWARMRSTIGSRFSLTNCAPGRGNIVSQPVRRIAEHPHGGPWATDADRSVAVLHRRVRLGPEAGRLAALQRRLLGDRRGPTATEERDLADGAGGDRQLGRDGHRRGGDDVRRGLRRARQRSRARTDVGKRVCTTDCSAANGRAMTSVRRGDGCRPVDGDRRDRGAVDRGRGCWRSCRAPLSSSPSARSPRLGRTAGRSGTRSPGRRPSRRAPAASRRAA